MTKNIQSLCLRVMLVFIGSATPLMAQDFGAFREFPDKNPLKLSYKQDSKANSQNHENAAISLPLYKSENSAANVSFQGDRLRTYQNVPISGELGEIPNELGSASANLQYGHRFESDNTLILQGGWGASGTQIWKKTHHHDYSFNGIYKINSDPNTWYLFLNYSNNRSFLNGVPLPGFAYEWKYSDDLSLILGMPIFSVFWKSSAKSFTNLIISPWAVAAGHSWFFLGPYRLNLKTKWSPKSYKNLLEAENKRLFYEESHVSASLQGPVGGGFSLEFGIAENFFRKFYVSESTFKERTDSVDLNSEFSIFAEISIRFPSGR